MCWDVLIFSSKRSYYWWPTNLRKLIAWLAGQSVWYLWELWLWEVACCLQHLQWGCWAHVSLWVGKLHLSAYDLSCKFWSTCRKPKVGFALPKNMLGGGAVIACKLKWGRYQKIGLVRPVCWSRRLKDWSNLSGCHHLPHPFLVHHLWKVAKGHLLYRAAHAHGCQAVWTIRDLGTLSQGHPARFFLF